MWIVSGLIIAFAFILLLAIGMPVSFSMIAVGFVGMLITVGPDVSLAMLGETIYNSTASGALSSIPLFILMGQVLLKSGIGRDIFMTAQLWLGRIPGGLASAAVGACAVFAAMCGSSTATSVTIGTIATPTMIKLGYDKSLACGVVAAAGALGPLIPPSIALIVYGVAAEVSIGKLFVAAVVPGVLLAIVMIIQVTIMVLMNPKLAPLTEGASWEDRIKGLVSLLVPMTIIFVVLGSIYLGFATPTESAGLGTALSIIYAFGSGRIKLKDFIDGLMSSVSFSCMIMLLIVGGGLMGKLVAMQMIAQNLANFIVHLPISGLMIIAAMEVAIFFGGMLIESCALILLCTPVFMPAVIALGFDPIVFGVAFAINLATAVITPPFAANLYVMKGIMPDVPFYDITRGALKFLAAEIIILILVIVFPQISLWLPSMMK